MNARPVARYFTLALLICSACDGSTHVVIEPVIQTPDGTAAHSGGGGQDARTDSGTRDSGSPSNEPDAQITPTPDASIDAGLDPDIEFEWVQTLPGQGMCGPGHYAGSFTCIVESDGLFGDGQVAGPITFDLVRGATEERLTIADGRLSDIIGWLFSATLEGSLDCVDRELTAIAVDGRAGPAGDFGATLKGDFDDQSLVISGVIEMTSETGDMCRGAFEASAIP